jgi:hypothetical protein
MPQVLYVGADDEISDVIEAVRRSSDNAVALVLPDDAKVFQTPLNLKLLAQFTASAEKQTSLITGDSRMQRLGHDQGFTTYASVQAYERGIEVVRPHDDGGLADAPSGKTQDVSPKQPVAPPVVAKPGRTGDKRRAQLYGGIGVAVIGLLAVIFISPSATITLTVAATPVADTNPIQGGTAAPAAGQNDYVQTQIVTAQETNSFQANPTGTQQIPATAASGAVVLESRLSGTAVFSSSSPNGPIPQGYQFQTSSNPPIIFAATQDTDVTIPPGNGSGGYGQPSNPIPVADITQEAKGNVAAGAIDAWGPGQDPCSSSKNKCSPGDLKVINLAPTTGGADAKTVGTAQSSDIQNWNSQVNTIKQQLTPKIQSDMKSRANGRVFALSATDDPQNTGLPPVSCALNPQLPTEGAQFSATKITVTCQASGVTYSLSDVRQQVLHDLNATKPQNEQLVTDNCQIPTPATSQVSPDGTIALTFSGSGVTCFSTPPVQGESLKSQLACKSPDDAKQLLQDANNRRLQNIDIAQHPFGLFFLPCLSSRISVNVSYLQTQPPSAATPTP